MKIVKKNIIEKIGNVESRLNGIFGKDLTSILKDQRWLTIWNAYLIYSTLVSFHFSRFPLELHSFTSSSTHVERSLKDYISHGPWIWLTLKNVRISGFNSISVWKIQIFSKHWRLHYTTIDVSTNVDKSTWNRLLLRKRNIN